MPNPSSHAFKDNVRDAAKTLADMHEAVLHAHRELLTVRQGLAKTIAESRELLAEADRLLAGW